MQLCRLTSSPPFPSRLLKVGMQGTLLKALQADLVNFMGAVGGPAAKGVAAVAASLPMEGFTSTMTSK